MLQLYIKKDLLNLLQNNIEVVANVTIFIQLQLQHLADYKS